jgi:hypothetical protein
MIPQPPATTESAQEQSHASFRAHEGHARTAGERRKTVSWSVALIVAAITGLAVGLCVGYGLSGTSIASQPGLPSMGQCVSDTVGTIAGKNPVNADNLREARDHCYSLIQAQGTLNDFAIRKLNFFQQYRANGVLMWMVVAVTFAGVLLAGVQLWASYKLAAASGALLPSSSSELTLETNRIIVRSSITGLLILLVSFCFFLVFVFYVYRFEMPADQSRLNLLPPGPTLPMGGLGPPPQQSAH